MIITINGKTIKVNTLSSVEKIEEKKLFKKKRFGIKVHCIEYFKAFTNKDEFTLFFKDENERNSAYADLDATFKKFGKESFHEQFKFTFEQKSKLDKRCVNFIKEESKKIASNWQGECYLNEEAEIYLATKVESFMRDNMVLIDKK